MSYSAFFSLNQEIAQTIHSIIRFYLPEGGRIYDPTCGKENFQFKSWIESLKLDGTRYEYISSDLKPFGDFQADLWHLPLQDKFAHCTVYDPPFTPTATSDPRSEQYNIEVERKVEDVLEYYSKKIYDELLRVTKWFIVVRGQDFYYPPNTCNYYPFHTVVLKKVPKQLELRAIYPYRFNHHRLPLYRENLKNHVRPIITHGAIAILATPEAPKQRDGAAIKHIVMAQNWGNRRNRLEKPLI